MSDNSISDVDHDKEFGQFQSAIADDTVESIHNEEEPRQDDQLNHDEDSEMDQISDKDEDSEMDQISDKDEDFEDGKSPLDSFSMWEMIKIDGQEQIRQLPWTQSIDEAMTTALDPVVDELHNAMGALLSKDSQRRNPRNLLGGDRYWDGYATRTRKCVLRFVKDLSTKFAIENMDFATCRHCFISRYPCLRYHPDRGYYTVPLPAVLRKDIGPTDIRYFVYDELRANRGIEKLVGLIWT